MTIGKVLAMLEAIQPNQFGQDAMIIWLNQIDKEIWHSVVRTHEGWEEIPVPHYGSTTEEDTELLVPDMYGSLYVHWLQSRMDYAMGEIGHYNNSNAMFEKDLQEFRNWYNRNHMPMRTEARYW